MRRAQHLAAEHLIATQTLPLFHLSRVIFVYRVHGSREHLRGDENENFNLIDEHCLVSNCRSIDGGFLVEYNVHR